MAKRIQGFGERDARRIANAVRRVESMKDMPVRRQRRFTSTPERLKFYNQSGEKAPQYAAMKIVGRGVFNGIDCITIEKPDEYNLHDVVFNLSGDVEYNQIGDCVYSPAVALYEHSYGTPQQDYGLGTLVNSWKLGSKPTSGQDFGFVCRGIKSVADRLVYVEKAGTPGAVLRDGADTVPALTSQDIDFYSGRNFGDQVDTSGSAARIVIKHYGLYYFSAVFNVVNVGTSGNPFGTAYIKHSDGAVGYASVTDWDARQTTNPRDRDYHRTNASCIAIYPCKPGDEITLYVENDSGTHSASIDGGLLTGFRINAYADL